MAEKAENWTKLQNPNRIRSYFALEKSSLFLVTISGILYNIGMVAGPWFEGALAQCLYDILGGKQTVSDMVVLSVWYIAVILFIQVMRYLKRFYVRRFSNNVNRNMKHILYNNLVHKSKAEYEQESVGGIMTKAIIDVDTCAEGMRKFTTEVFDTGIAMTAYVVMLLRYDWRLALLSCIFPPFAYLIAQKLKKIVSKSSFAYKESAGKLNSATLDRVAGALTYRVYGQEKQRNAAYEQQLADYEKKAIRANIWENAMHPLYRVMSMTSVLFILWFGAKNVQGSGWTVWNLAAFTTFLSCFTKLANKSSRAAKLFNSIQKAEVSWRRIQPLMQQEITDEEVMAAEPAVLEVKNLTFTYPNGTNIFRNLTFTAKPGNIIGVTGPVACGKSTLGRVFLWEYPYEGSIRFGGQEWSLLSRQQRCGIVGYMGHHPELMSDSVEANILLGEERDASEYVRAVCLENEIAQMPQKMQTRIGDEGIRLSGGQQERVALARTLCHSRPLMILDDPFASVDRVTEQEILKHLKELVHDSIVIVLSHRLYMFPECQQVIWMEGGEAIVSTHEKLMQSHTEYAKLYQMQTQMEGGIES